MIRLNDKEQAAHNGNGKVNWQSNVLMNKKSKFKDLSKPYGICMTILLKLSKNIDAGVVDMLASEALHCCSSFTYYRIQN